MRAFSFRLSFPWIFGLCLAVAAVATAAAVGIELTRRDHDRHLLHAWAGVLAGRMGADLGQFDIALRQEITGDYEIIDKNLLPPLKHPLTDPRISFIDVLNEAGDVIASSRINVSRPANFAGRDYFLDLQRSAIETSTIGRPFGGAIPRNALIPVARRVTAPGGTFAGAAVAGIRVSWLRDLLTDLPAGVQVTVRRADGVVLTRYPFDLEQDNPPLFSRPVPGWAVTLDVAMAPDPSHGMVAALALLAPLGALLLLGLHGLGSRRRAARGAAHDHEERMRLMAAMSHELRTPLTGILGQADLLHDEGGLTPKQAERLARMREAGTLMRDIVDRVIDVSGPEDQAITPVPTAVDLDQVIRTCRGIVEPAARAKRLTLIAWADPAAPRHALLDRTLVEQALTNLLMNAVKFTAAGQIGLRLSADPDWLRFEVSDTGPGIGGMGGRLFRAWDRLGVDAASVPGNGLGLAITRRLVTAMGGRIGHRDNPGGGSVFWIVLPFTAPASSPDAPPAVTAPTRALSILLADDMAVTRAVTADHLRAAGHRVTEAEDGETALRLLERQPFDLLLTDMRMPGMDGIETARQVRALPGCKGRLPIVLVTADLNARQRAATSDPAIDLCLMKPFRRADLLEAVDAASSLTRPALVLDDAVLAQMRDSLGLDRLHATLDQALTRIEALLPWLDRPAAPDDRTAHDLIGMAGLLGLTSLGQALAAFERDPGTADALRAAAAETIASLKDHLADARVLAL